MHVYENNHLNKNLNTILNYDAIEEVDSSNCKKLWSIVIEFALIDASSQRIKFRDRRLKREATEWIMDDNENFFEVCCLADINPQIVRNNLARLLNGKLMYPRRNLIR